MKVVKLLCVCLIVIVMLVGCNPVSTALSEIPADTTKMTQEEIDVLVDTYPNEADIILSGDLYLHHNTALKELRVMREYLNKKYPNEEISIVSYNPEWLFQDYASFGLKDADGKAYASKLEQTKLGYKCTDDYYGKILRNKYDAFIKSTLEESGYVLEVYTTFVTFQGEEINSETTVNEFLELAPKTTRYTHIFVLGAKDLETISERIEEIIIANNIYGCYAVYAVDNIQWGDVSEMEEGCLDYERVRFNWFCEELSGVDMFDLDTSNVRRMGEMFYGCESVSKESLPEWAQQYVCW